MKDKEKVEEVEEEEYPVEEDIFFHEDTQTWIKISLEEEDYEVSN